MPQQIIDKAGRHDIALRYDGDVGRDILTYLIDDQRVVGTTKQDGVYFGVLFKKSL